MFKFIKRNFIAGILVILPVLFTVYILIILFRFVDSIFGKLINYYLGSLLGFYIPGLGLVIFFIIIFLVGVLTRAFIGRKLYLFLDRILHRFPLISHIYPSVKQIIEFLFSYQTKRFKRVVLVEYPKDGIWSIGFVTNEGLAQAKIKTKEDLLSIFIPSSPGPLTGFFIFTSAQKVISLEISVEEAIKLIVSGGLLTPPISKN